MSRPDQRIMRIPLPVPLIREMDTVIVKGVGGYTTRAEFIVDAIQERVLELTFSETEDAGPLAAPPALPTERLVTQVPANPSSATPQLTTIVAPQSGFALHSADGFARPEGKTLFGLHNRDYPSLWALAKLAALTSGGPRPVEECYVRVMHDAWEFGKLLLAIEEQSGRKCTALFPTNGEKRKAAEMGFRVFAIGDYRARPDGNTYATSGPLFEWGAVSLTHGEAAEPLIGVTAAGWELLSIVDGMTIEEPRPASACRRFLAHLLDHAPADHAGFVEIVQAIGDNGAPRQEVLDHVSKAWPDWSDNEVSTNSAGYIARAREWGLVEPRQIKGRYHLTELGIQLENGAK